MKHSTKVVIAVGLVAGIGAMAIAGTSYAHKWRDGHQAYHAMESSEWQGKRHGHHGRRGMMFLKQFDANGDGKLTQVEIDETRSERFSAFDGDGDGALSLQEYEGLWLDAMRERMVDRFQYLDDDGDASVTKAEFQEPFSAMVTMMDRNGDGVLSRDDRPRRGKHHYYDDRDDDDDDDDDEREDN